MSMPKRAMVMAAGLGTRMRPLTDDRPKALVDVGGRTLLDHQLDRLSDAGVEKAIVNVHHFADRMEAHLAARKGAPKIMISDERDCLLETGGGLVKAAPMLGDAPFFVMNVDPVWLGHDTALQDLARMFDRNPDALGVLLLVRKANTLGLATAGDFHLDADGRVRRRGDDPASDHYYTGIQILHPDLLGGYGMKPFSTNLMWDDALAQGRLYGLELDGFWMHVGDPEARAAAEAKLEEAAE